MTDRVSTLNNALLVILYVAVLLALPFLADRSVKLYGFVALTLLAGCLLLAISRKVNLSWLTVILVGVLLRIGALWMPPSLSDDTYRYVWDGRLQVERFNPYLYLPSDDRFTHLRDAEVFDRLNSSEFYSVYPPLSQATFAAASWLTKSRWPATYYVIKVILLLAELAALIGLARLTSASRGVLYAWNPIVVIEIAGQGHTEGLAAALMVLGMFAAHKRRGWILGMLMAGAGMVKLYPFLFLPPIWRRFGWKCAVASVATVALIALPYAAHGVVANVRDSLDLYVKYFEFNAGPYYAAKEILRVLTGDDWSKTLGPAFRTLFLIAVPVIYVADWKYKWPLERVLVTLLAAFFALSTTVHPWYLVPLMAILVLEDRFKLHWYWLMLVSAGTYLLYIDGPYWEFVVLGWAGWAVTGIIYHFDAALQRIQHLRGLLKWRSIRDWMQDVDPDYGILDLGCGEGYVGLHASRETAARVVLADVVDMNRTRLPWRKVDESHLPFADDEFDFVILYYVLHHASTPEAVVAEAVRVARRGVVVAESVFETHAQQRLLTILDLLVNRIRSGRRMDGQEQYLAFRRASDWRRSFVDLGFKVVEERRSRALVHKKSWFLIRK